jgi:Zn-dependent protease with chaperone function
VEDLFFKLGQKAGSKLRKGRWLWSSLTGSESEGLAAEYEAGSELAAGFDGDNVLDGDEHSQAFLVGIQGRLEGRLTNKERRWRVLSICTDSPGAFALPGGFLYVTRSLLELCEYNEDELACVVGHEMGHVVHGHAMERITNQLLTSAAAQAARLPAGLLSQWIMKTGVNLLFSAYSQDQEFQADEFGARLAAAAGYDPRGAIRALERFRKIEPENGQPLAEYFSTHPPSAQRIERLQRLIRVRD